MYHRCLMPFYVPAMCAISSWNCRCDISDTYPLPVWEVGTQWYLKCQVPVSHHLGSWYRVLKPFQWRWGPVQATAFPSWRSVRCASLLGKSGSWLKRLLSISPAFSCHLWGGGVSWEWQKLVCTFFNSSTSLSSVRIWKWFNLRCCI